MKLFIPYFFMCAFLFSQVSPAAVTCEDVMKANFVNPNDIKVFSPSGLKVFRSQFSKREMVYDFKRGTRDRFFVLIHGLGDDMSKMEKLAEMAERDGYSILRIDLHGHGITLRNYLDKHDNRLPDEINYADNISDIQELIQTLESPISQEAPSTNLVIVGHSYGGGIAYGLAAELAKRAGPQRLHVESVHMLAPYVQRIDKFLADYMKSPEYVVDKTVETLEASGMKPVFVKSIMDPLFALTWAMTLRMKTARAILNKSLNLDHTKDLVMDPWMESFMKKSYRKYFIKATGKQTWQLSAEQKQEIDVKVEAAIKVTRGIRSFDLLDPTTDVPSVHAPLQVIGGKKDKLVVPGQLESFHFRLSAAHIDHDVEFLEGKNSHHLFPQFMATEVYQRILSFNQQSRVGGD